MDCFRKVTSFKYVTGSTYLISHTYVTRFNLAAGLLYSNRSLERNFREVKLNWAIYKKLDYSMVSITWIHLRIADPRTHWPGSPNRKIHFLYFQLLNPNPIINVFVDLLIFLRPKIQARWIYWDVKAKKSQAEVGC